MNLPPEPNWMHGLSPRRALLRLGRRCGTLACAILAGLALTCAVYLAAWLCGPSAQPSVGAVTVAALGGPAVAALVAWPLLAWIAELDRERSALAAAALRDGPTQLYNRVFLIERLGRDIDRAARSRQSLSLLMIDVDQFKRVNDEHGHQAGDVVLQAVAQSCMLHQGEHDVLARYGGDELVLLLYGQGRDAAMESAERIRASVEGMRLYSSASIPRVTISVGVSTLLADGDRLRDVIERADRALFRAKRAGRNCCRHAEDGTNGTGTEAPTPS